MVTINNHPSQAPTKREIEALERMHQRNIEAQLLAWKMIAGAVVGFFGIFGILVISTTVENIARDSNYAKLQQAELQAERLEQQQQQQSQQFESQMEVAQAVDEIKTWDSQTIQIWFDFCSTAGWQPPKQRSAKYCSALRQVLN